MGLGDIQIGIQFLAVTRDISLFHSILTGSDIHPASCLVGMAVSFPVGKSAGT
jgi:hypothetical protein